MITYCKKSLKVKIVSAENPEGRFAKNYADIIAFGIQHFIETGNYSRIADIKIYGDGFSTRALIIYEKKKEEVK